MPPNDTTLLSMPRAFALLALLTVVSTTRAQTTPDDPNRVLVVYNAAWPDQDGNGVGDSLEVAQHYAMRRHVPRTNLLGLKLSSTNRIRIPGNATTSWTYFHDNVVTPLNAKLTALGANKIDSLLLCYGVPHQIISTSRSQSYRALDSLLIAPQSLGTRAGWGFNGWWRSNPYFEHSPGVGVDRGRFDHRKYQYLGRPYYLVSRIDGIHMDAAKDLVDAAIYAETFGSKGAGKMEGTAYIDSRHGFKSDTYLKTNYPNYPGFRTFQLWSYRMSYGKLLPGKVGLPVKWEYSNYEIGERNSANKVLARWSDQTPAAAAPDALLYFGWYNYIQYLDVWTWLPGSVACDLNSNSIRDFHNPKRSRKAFLSEAFELGLTAGCGVIAEPYLSGHARPEILLYYLIEGYTFAEAAALADPVIFWRGVRMGDPLYTPFKKTHVRRKDTSAPPLPSSKTLVRGTTTATLSVRIAPSGTDPELSVATIAWGKTPARTQTTRSRTAFHRRHDLVVQTLDAKWPGYHARTTVTDPAGNRTTGRPFAFTARPFQAVEARVLAVQPSIQVGGPLDLRFSVAAKPDLTKITVFRFEARAPGSSQWVDLTGAATALWSDLGIGQDLECLLFRLHVPKWITARGTYAFRLRAGTAAASSVGNATIVVR